ncbi:MAG TPA: NAD-binding protein [Gammaproteobacteria bacterium]|jgi:adenosylhomocysteinase|nr:NAD-binding protein [Gammaproteobacteria bacterium]
MHRKDLDPLEQYHVDEVSSDEGIEIEAEKVDGFFKKIIEHFGHDNLKRQKKLAFVIVTHTLPTLPAFLLAIVKYFNDAYFADAYIARVILKSSEKDKKTLRYIKKKKKDLEYKSFLEEYNVKKEDLRDFPDFELDHIFSSFRTQEDQCIIMDIGGYFASKNCLKLLEEKYKEGKLLGIVEDTENGQQKYEKSLKEIPVTFPIYSIARSQLKQTEDYNVGKSIVHAADTMLRTEFNMRSENHPATAVIGFGKIGSSIAEHLRQKNIGKVLVFDKDPNRLLYASSQGFNVVNREELIKKATVIYCATGNKALSGDDFKSFGQKQVFLVLCTSADDELDLSNIEIERERSRYSCYKTDQGAIYILGKEKAANFYYKAIVGDYIRAVQAGLLVGAIKILESEDNKGLVDKAVPDKKDEEIIKKLGSSTEDTIARIWLSEFCQIEFDCVYNLREYKNRIERKELEKKIHKELFSSSREAFKSGSMIINLHGKSGYGKSFLSEMFGYKNRQYYDVVIKMDVSKKHRQFYLELASRLGVEQNQELDQIKAAVHKKLETKEHALFIFDNVNSSEEIDKTNESIKALSALTSGRRHFICVSKKNLLENEIFRKADHHAGISAIEIGEFSQEEARSCIEYIAKHHYSNFLLEENSSHSDDFLEKFGKHPQTVAICFSHYMEFFVKKSIDFDEFCICVNPDSPIESVLRDIQNKLQDLEIGRWDFFSMLAFFDDQIEFDIVEKCYNSVFSRSDASSMTRETRETSPNPALRRTSSSQVTTPSLEELLRFFHSLHLLSYVNGEDESEGIILHSEVKVKLHEINKMKLYDAALNIIREKFKYDFYSIKPDEVNRIRSYIMHVKCLVNFIQYPESIQTVFDKEDNQLEFVQLLENLASYLLNEDRNYEESLYFYNLLEKFLAEIKTSSVETKELQLKATHGACTNEYLLCRETEDGSSKLKKVLERMEKVEKELPKRSATLYRNEHFFQARVYITLSYINKSLFKLLSSKETYRVEANRYLELANGSLKSHRSPVGEEQSSDVDLINRLTELIEHAKAGIFALNEDYFGSCVAFNAAVKLREEKLSFKHPDLARSRQKLANSLLRVVQKANLQTLTPGRLEEESSDLSNLEKIASEFKIKTTNSTDSATRTLLKTVADNPNVENSERLFKHIKKRGETSEVKIKRLIDIGISVLGMAHDLCLKAFRFQCQILLHEHPNIEESRKTLQEIKKSQKDLREIGKKFFSTPKSQERTERKREDSPLLTPEETGNNGPHERPAKRLLPSPSQPPCTLTLFHPKTPEDEKDPSENLTL